MRLAGAAALEKSPTRALDASREWKPLHVDSKSPNGQTSRWNTILPPKPALPNHLVALQGLDSRDVAFMERLRNLAREALTWEHFSDQQRLVWAAALELDVVPVQEMRAVGGGCSL